MYISENTEKWVLYKHFNESRIIIFDEEYKKRLEENSDLKLYLTEHKEENDQHVFVCDEDVNKALVYHSFEAALAAMGAILYLSQSKETFQPVKISNSAE